MPGIKEKRSNDSAEEQSRCLFLLSRGVDEATRPWCNGERRSQEYGIKGPWAPSPHSSSSEQSGIRSSRLVPFRPSQPAALGGLSPPSAPSCSLGEAMRKCWAGVYISLRVSHLAKHERKALGETLCSLPLGLQLPFTLPAHRESNQKNHHHTDKKHFRKLKYKTQEDSAQNRFLRIIS